MRRLIALVLIPFLMWPSELAASTMERTTPASNSTNLFRSESFAPRVVNFTDRILSHTLRLWEFLTLRQELLRVEAVAGLGTDPLILPMFYLGKRRNNSDKKTPPERLAPPSSGPKDPRRDSWFNRHRLATGLLALSVTAAGIVWIVTSRHSNDRELNTPPSVSVPQSTESEAQQRLLRAARLATDRVKNGFLDGSPTRDAVLDILNRWITAPRIIPMTDSETADGSILGHDPADNGAIRVNLQAFADPANANLDLYLDAALVHELSHAVGKQIARNTMIALLDKEAQQNPEGITFDNDEGTWRGPCSENQFSRLSPETDKDLSILSDFPRSSSSRQQIGQPGCGGCGTGAAWSCWGTGHADGYFSGRGGRRRLAAASAVCRSGLG
jgi:hypothetical protein